MRVPFRSRVLLSGIEACRCRPSSPLPLPVLYAPVPQYCRIVLPTPLGHTNSNCSSTSPPGSLEAATAPTSCRVQGCWKDDGVNLQCGGQGRGAVIQRCRVQQLVETANSIPSCCVGCKPAHPWMFAVAVASAPPLPGYTNTAWDPNIIDIGAYAQDTQPVPEDLRGGEGEEVWLN